MCLGVKSVFLHNRYKYRLAYSTIGSANHSVANHSVANHSTANLIKRGMPDS